MSSSDSSDEAEFNSSDDELDVLKSTQQLRKKEQKETVFARTSTELVKSRQRSSPTSAAATAGTTGSTTSGVGAGAGSSQQNKTSTTKHTVGSISTSSSSSSRSPPLAKGTRVYAEYTPNGQYYWGWVFGVKESKVAAGVAVNRVRRYYKVYFEDGDVDERVPSHHVFTEDQCRMGNQRQQQVVITKEPPMPNDLKDLLGLLNKEEQHRNRNRRARSNSRTSSTTTNNQTSMKDRQSKKKRHREHHHDDKIHDNNTNDDDDVLRPPNKQSKTNNATAIAAVTDNIRARATVVDSTFDRKKQKQLKLHETFLQNWNIKTKKKESLTLEQLYKYRCGICELCCADDCGKCQSCQENKERGVYEGSTTSNYPSSISRPVCVRNMCCEIPIECKQQDITDMIFPRSKTPWYFAYVKVEPNDYIYCVDKFNPFVEAALEEQQNLSKIVPKSHLVLINHVERFYKGGLKVLLERLPEGSYGLTREDIQYAHMKFHEFYKLIGESM